jgi:hypothetical protein
MHDRYVEVPVKEMPKVEEEMMKRPPMDFYTKVEGSCNTMVQKNQERLNWQKKKREASINNRNLTTIEQDALSLID